LNLNVPEGLCSVDVVPDLSSKTVIPVGLISVRQRDRRFDLSDLPDIRRRVTVGNFGHLIGADVTGGGKDLAEGRDVLQAGDPLSVTLYWQALGTADEDYTVFVHAVGPDGITWGQSDAWPDDGQAPTTTWVADEVIVDAHSFSLREDAPPGVYTLFVGFYNAERGTRQPLYDENGRLPDDRLSLTSFQVTRP
jgi:hypothetical protein